MKLSFKNENRRRLLERLPDSELLPRLVREWYRSAQGIAVLEAECAIVKPIISRLFGYHILQVGPNDEFSLIDESPVGHKIIFAPSWRRGIQNAVSDIEELPLETDSIDVVVVHHALDFTDDSHKLLREVTRVLRPGGHMLIVGFNPVSPWGFWRMFKRKTYLPWRGRFLSKRRLGDWLQLLNLQIDSVDYGLHFLPLKFASLLRRAKKIERLCRKLHSPLGGAYFVLCVKQVPTITPEMPKWRPLRSPATATAIPATENVRLKIH